jgi:hypothetical protein
MQAFLRISALAALCAAVIPAWAAVVQGAPQRVEITAPLAAARAVLAIVDEDQHFELANGRRAVVNVDGDTLQLSYRHRRSLLKHDGQGNFVSGDGRISLQLALDAAGRPGQLAIQAPAGWF